jgi:phosphate-selective porin OprO/OprP
MDRTRTGLEGVVAFGPFKVQTEMLKANFSGDGGYDRDIDTAYVDAMWTITGEKYIDSYSINGMKSIKPAKSIESGGWGAWEVGVRFSQFDADDQFVASAASTNKADAITFGVKWIPNNFTRFMLNYITTDFDTPISDGTNLVDNEKAVNLRAQIYF